MGRTTTIAIALALAACGTDNPAPGNDGDDSATGGSTSPATTDADTGTSGLDDGSGDGGNDPGDPVALRCPDDPEGTDPLILLATADAGAGALADVVATDTHAFACSTVDGLVAWDITDPEAPSVVLAADGTPCAALSLAGDRLAVARTDRVELLDITDPGGPSVVAESPAALAAQIHAVALGPEGTQVHAAAGTDGVIALDVDGSTLAERGRHTDETTDARALAYADTQLVVAQGRHGVSLVDPTAASPTPLATAAVPGVALGLAVQDTTAWVTTLEGVTVVDVGPAALTEGSSVATTGQALDVAVGEHFAVVADWDTLVGLDLDPAAPAIVTAEPLPNDHPQPRTRSTTVTPAGRVLAVGNEALWVYGPACPVAAPAVFSEPAYLPFHATDDGPVAGTRVMSIRNRGNRPLTVQEIITPAGLSVDETLPLTVGPGAATPVEVSFDPDAGPGGNLTLVTDDPDEPMFEVEAATGVLGTTLGDDPVPLRAVDLDGRVWDVDELAGQVVLLAYFATW